MRLIIYCKECNASISLKKIFPDRGEYKKQYGNTLNLKCKKCHSTKKYSVDDIKAKHGYLGIFATIALFPIIVFIFYKLLDLSWKASGSVYIVPVALVILLAIYSTFLFSETTNIRNFNRS